MKLYQTPWLKPTRYCPNTDLRMPNGELLLCISATQEFFDFQDTDTIRFVAYNRPGKFRYLFKIHMTVQILACGIISYNHYPQFSLDGWRYKHILHGAFDDLLIRLYQRFGSTKLYVECEIK